MAVRCRTPRSGPGGVRRRTSLQVRKNSRVAPGSTRSRRPDAMRPRWRARRPERPKAAHRKRVTSPQSPPSVSAAEAADTVVDVRDVHYAVGGREIFSGLTLRARAGRITAVMGPSGAGKTTLLRLITAQNAADSGEVRVFGQDVAGLSGREIYGIRRRMGMLFQNGALLTDMSVFEN